MGQFRFAVPSDQIDALDLWESAYICGIEGVPWEGRVTLEEGMLTVHRSVDDSGRLYIPYPIAPGGPLATLATCSLRQNGPQTSQPGGASPYQLPLELARGECFRLRTQADLWRRSGLQPSESLWNQLQSATDAFLRAATTRGSVDAIGRAANAAISQLHRTSGAWANCYNHQAIEYRKQSEGQLGTLLGATVGAAASAELVGGGPLQQPFLDAFNTIGIPVGWGAVETDAGKVNFAPFDAMFEWAIASGLRIVAGPLLDFQPRLLPQWAYLVEDDFDTLIDAVERYVERTVLRYQGRVTLWHAIAGLNTPGPMTLDEEQIMRLAVAVIHTIRRVDRRTPVVISVDQPWGEYLGRTRDGISPLHFTDALIRSNLGIAGVGLEMRMNYAGAGSLPRTLLDLGQQIDRWSALGLPLLVQLAMPAAAGHDPEAIRNCDVIPLGPDGQSDAALQCKVAIHWIRTLIAKGVVHGILWDGWDDRYPHTMPHSGLIDAAGVPRPLLEHMTALRRQLLH